VAITENTFSEKGNGFSLTDLVTLFTGHRIYIMELFGYVKKYVCKKKMPLKRLKINHMEN